METVTSARETLYHGTTTPLARQILSEGFVPNPRRRVWDQEARQLASYSGTYLTRDLKVAWEAAEQAVSKFGGERCIIEAQIETRTGLMDEDELPELYYSVVWVALSDRKPDVVRKQKSAIAQHWIEAFAEEFFDDMDVRFAASPLLRKHLQKPVEHWVVAWANALESGVELDPEERKFETTPELQAAKGRVIRAIGNIAKLSQGKNVRVLTPIRFKGANKIISAVFSPHPGHSVLKKLDRASALCIVYGKPSARFKADAAKLWGRGAAFLRCGTDMLTAKHAHVYAKEEIDPDQYREQKGRCPRGYSYDGEKCVKTAPKDEPEGTDAPGGEKPAQPKSEPSGGKPKAKPKKPKPKPDGPQVEVTKDNPYGLAESVREAETLAELGGHEAITKVLGHMEPSKRPPPDIDPGSVKLDLEGDNDSKALMTWRDAKRRLQAAYTPRFLKRNAAKKWERVKQLEQKADEAIEKFDDIMMDGSKTDRERDAAAIMSIIGKTGLRPGSAGGLKSTGHRGVSTLAADNVKVEGGVVTLDFVGKSGKRNETRIEDPGLAAYLKDRLEQKSGDELLFDATARDLPDTMEAAGVGDFKPKDFRTRMAGKIAAKTMAKLEQPPPPMPSEPKKAKRLVELRIRQASTAVADQLNNTPAMAKTAYINPAIFQAWAEAVGATDFVGAAAGADKLSADALWRAALETTLPEADRPVDIEPELEGDEQLETVPMPDIKADEKMAESIVASLLARRHVGLARAFVSIW